MSVLSGHERQLHVSTAPGGGMAAHGRDALPRVRCGIGDAARPTDGGTPRVLPSLEADLVCEVNGTRRLDDSQLAISVCIPTYNSERTIVRAVDTILHQTYSNYEVVISDNASTDRTVDAVRACLEAYEGPVRVRLYRARENGGIVRNRLRGMSYAGGGVYVQTDGDDFSLPTRLETIARTWQALGDSRSILVTNARRYCTEDGRISDSLALPSDIRRDYPPGDPIDSPIPAFSAGFVIAREVFETFREVEVPKGLIADDPVFARRALLLKGLHVDLEPVFFYGTSRKSASGGGVSGKNWIIDRYRRWCLLERDIQVLRPVTADESVRLERLKKRMHLDAKLIDCSLFVWPFYWIRMWFISGDEAVAALKKRIKLIVTGSVNGSARQSRLLRLFCR